MGLRLIFRRATWAELLLNAIGLVAAIAAGAAQPLMALLFGRLTTTFTEFQGQLRAEANGLTPYASTASLKRSADENAIWLVVLGAGLYFATYVYMSTWGYTGESITRRIREDYLRSVLDQDIGWHDKHGAGSVTGNIATDTQQLQSGISEKVPLAMMYASTFVSGFVVAITQSWRLALVLAAAMIPSIGAAGVAMELIISNYKKRSMTRVAAASSLCEEFFSGIRMVHAFSCAKALNDAYDKVNGLALADDLRAAWGVVIGYATFGFVQYCGYALAFWYGTTLILNGQATSGQIVAAFFSILTGSFSLAEAAPKLQAVSTGSGAAKRLLAVIEREPSIRSSSSSGLQPETCSGAIEFREIKFNYPARPDVTVLQDFSLVCPSGTSTALVGPSGSGKSTITGLMARFYDTLSGDVLIDGIPVRELNVKWLRSQIGMVTQEPVLFAATVKENIEYGLNGRFSDDTLERRTARVIEAASTANAHDFILGLPKGYDTHIGEKGLLLSGGQRQRVAIARAIISEPPILILDEATSALDSASEAIVQEALDKASANRTSIIVAHRLSTIRNADQIAVLVNGRLAESARTSPQVSAHQRLSRIPSGIYAELASSQPSQTRAAQADPVLSETQMKQATTRDILTKETFVNGAFVDDEPRLRPKRKTPLLVVLWRLITLTSSSNEMGVWLAMVVASVITGTVLPVFAMVFGGAVDGFSYDRQTERAALRNSGDHFALLSFVAALIVCAATSIQMLLALRQAETLASRLRSRLLGSILRHRIAFFDQVDTSAGSLTSDVRGLPENVSALLGTTGATLIQDFATVVAGVIIGLIFAWRLSLVGIACVPLLLAAGIARLRLLESKDTMNAESHVASAQYASEAAAAIRTVASLNREMSCGQEYSRRLDEPMRRTHRVILYGNNLYALSQAISFWVIALVFWYGSRQLADRAINTKDFFTSMIAVTLATIEVGVTLAYVPDMSRSGVSARQILRYFDAAQGCTTGESQGELTVGHYPGDVIFRGVRFRYPSRPEVEVFESLDLDIPTGKFIALVGPSGSGKSTIIQLLQRFYDVLGGTIYLGGVPAHDFDLETYRGNFAVVAQEPALFSGSIFQNIALGARKPIESVTLEEVKRACDQANIHQFIMTLPDAYHTEIGAKGTMLSGGQKQRLSIARALIRDPKILLLDEATSALDNASEKVVQETLRQVSKARTTVAVAHRLTSIQHADIIYCLKQGRVVECGTHRELISRKGLYYELSVQQALEDKVA